MKIKNYLIAFGLIVVLTILTSCTDNERAKNWGGKLEIVLPKNEKLVTATFKNSNLWYLTRAAKPGEQPEILVFREDSGFGILQGVVVFKEQ